MFIKKVKKNKKKKMAKMIHDDAMKQIFLRLPLKSLVRFRCVSKRFNSLITSGDNGRRNKHPSSMIGLFVQQLNLAAVSSDFIETAHDTHLDVVSTILNNLLAPPCLRDLGIVDTICIEDICNGLVLCRLTKEARTGYAVCNPATGKWDTLLPADDVFSQGMLQFDPSSSSHYRAFFMQQRKSEKQSRYVIRTFSSETRRWEDIDTLFFIVPIAHCSCVYISGISYILPTMPPQKYIYQFGNNGKLGGRIRLPDHYFLDVNNGPRRQHIGLSRNHLHFAVVTEEDGLRVWSLRNPDEREWEVEAAIALVDVSRKLPSGCESSPSTLARGLEIQAFHMDQDVIFLKLLANGKILSYRWSTGDMREVYTVSTSGESICYPYSPSYRKETVSADNPGPVL